MNGIRRHFKFSNVVAVIALFMALSGAAYALTLPAGSVGTKQLKRGAVSTAKLKRNAVTSPKVRNGSLVAADFGAGQLAPIAYAHVNADATVSDAKNITATRSPLAPPKVYCINNTAGGAKNVQVTADAASTDPAYAQLSVITLRSVISGFGCPASTDFIVTTDSISSSAETRGVAMGFFVTVFA